MDGVFLRRTISFFHKFLYTYIDIHIETGCWSSGNYGWRIIFIKRKIIIQKWMSVRVFNNQTINMESSFFFINFCDRYRYYVQDLRTSLRIIIFIIIIMLVIFFMVHRCVWCIWGILNKINYNECGCCWCCIRFALL